MAVLRPSRGRPLPLITTGCTSVPSLLNGITELYFPRVSNGFRDPYRNTFIPCLFRSSHVCLSIILHEAPEWMSISFVCAPDCDIDSAIFNTLDMIFTHGESIVIIIHQIIYSLWLSHTYSLRMLMIRSLESIRLGFANTCKMSRFIAFVALFILSGHRSTFCKCPVWSHLSISYSPPANLRPYVSGGWASCCFDAALDGPLFWCPFWHGSFR